MGQDTAKKQFPNAVWPSWVPSIPGLAFGANGTLITQGTNRQDNGNDNPGDPKDKDDQGDQKGKKDK